MFSKDKSIIEYIFVDKPRVESYFEQISNPIAYVKVPSWKIILGLAGPKTEASQTKVGRPYTEHEKILKLIKYLKKHKLISDQPVLDPFEYKSSFTIETFTCKRVHIPENNDVKILHGLNIWVSTKRRAVFNEKLRWGLGHLLLIEDFRCENDNKGGQRFSGYSSLQILIDTSQDQSDNIFSSSVLTFR